MPTDPNQLYEATRPFFVQTATGARRGSFGGQMMSSTDNITASAVVLAAPPTIERRPGVQNLDRRRTGRS